MLVVIQVRRGRCHFRMGAVNLHWMDQAVRTALPRPAAIINSIYIYNHIIRPTLHPNPTLEYYFLQTLLSEANLILSCKYSMENILNGMPMMAPDRTRKSEAEKEGVDQAEEMEA